MSTFQECWKNWIQRPFGQPNVNEHAWINELNQAVFATLEKNLPGYVKVRSARAPTFIYHTEAPGGYGVIQHAAAVESRRIVLPIDSTFEERVDAAVLQLTNMINQPTVRTVFFYTPIVPCGPENIDGTVNRQHMSVRMKTLGETVDV